MIIVQPVGPAPTRADVARSALTIHHRLSRGRTGTLDAVLLDASGRQALVALRELGRAGLRVGAAATHGHAPAFASRWCQVSAVMPDFALHPQGFGDGLLSLLDRHPARVLMPTSPLSIAQLHALRPLLERQTRLALADDAPLRVAMDVEHTRMAATRLGITIPRRAILDSWDEVASAVRTVGLPALVRPRDDAGGLGAHAIIVRSEDDAWRAVESLAVRGDIAVGGAQVMIEQWLPGQRETISLLNARDRVWARFAQVTHRALPSLPGREGSPIVRESIALPRDAARDAQRLVRGLNLEGFVEAMFQRDANGRPVLIRLLPYLTDGVELALRAGINFPRLAFAWAAGEPLWSVPEYRVGQRLRWLGGDLRALKDALKVALARLSDPYAGADAAALAPGRALATLLLDSLRPTGYDTVDWRDPQPAITATARMVARTLLRRPVAQAEETLAALAPQPDDDTDAPPPMRGRATAPLGPQLG